jgi:hypothetical protein
MMNIRFGETFLIGKNVVVNVFLIVDTITGLLLLLENVANLRLNFETANY